jgi:hypothetical protein
MAVEFRPMRSIIYVDVCREEYRHRLQHWLYGHHIQDSISNFGPYVTKYAFYNALPVPPEGDRFGTRRMQMTEHYWLVNEMLPEMRVKAISEYMPLDVLRWQGCVPDTDETPKQNIDGDAGRSIGGDNGLPALRVRPRSHFVGGGLQGQGPHGLRWPQLPLAVRSPVSRRPQRGGRGEVVP